MAGGGGPLLRATYLASVPDVGRVVVVRHAQLRTSHCAPRGLAKGHLVVLAQASTVTSTDADRASDASLRTQDWRGLGRVDVPE
jgi:hypothetical protein